METTTTSATTLPEKIAQLFQSSREYVESKVELEVLKGADKIARGASSLVAFLIALALTIIIFIMLAIGGAILINRAMDSEWAGYFIVAGIVLVLMILIFTVGKNAIRKMVVNTILKNIDHD